MQAKPPDEGQRFTTRGAGRTRTWLSRNVLALGLVSLLTDLASEMVVPLLPVFITSVLGAGAFALGWIEGLAGAAAAVLRLVSGIWADRVGRSKPFILAGYGLASIVRPLFGLATAVWHVLALRVVDRLGKGLRGSPRDALLAASVAPGERGAAFGLHRAMDHAGAFLGPLAALAILTWWTTDLRTVFWLTAIPGGLALLAAWLGVRERSRMTGAIASEGAQQSGDSGDRGVRLQRRPLAHFLVPLGLFTLAKASEVFLLLKAGTTRSPLVSLPLLWMGIHLVKALASVPGGWISDRWGPRRTMSVGWLLYAIVFAGLAFVERQEAVWTLLLVYGLSPGLSEAPEKALITRLAPKARWGTAFGWYHLTLGLLSLPASVLFGTLWEAFDSRTAFLTSAGLATVALLSLWLLGLGRRGADRGADATTGKGSSQA